jgi:PAS domain S-box-containing protein
MEFSEQRTPSGRTICLRTDISDLKQREFELEQAQARYQSVLDSLADVVYELDVESGRFTFVSAGVEELFGIPASEFVGSHFLDHVAPESHDFVSRTTTRPYVEGDTRTVSHFRVKTRSGEIRHVEVRARRRLGQQGRVITIGAIRDVEERVQLERRLADEHAQLRAMFETGGAIVALVDRDLRYLMVNREFTRLTGRAAAEVIGRTYAELFGQPSQIDQETFDRWRAGPLPAGHSELMRYTMAVPGADGRQRTYNVTANPVTDEHGMLQQIVFMVVEDTERREALDLLKETIDTVPAGIVVYDQQERLVLFNAAAAKANPSLAEPNAIGRTYQELAHLAAQRMEKEGHGVQPIENWIRRFRQQGRERAAVPIAGRWFEWSEQVTASGRTVGLRVDITEVKRNELELQRSRDLLQSTLDALPAGVELYDKDERLVVYNRAAEKLSNGVVRPQALGKTFSELVEMVAGEQKALGGGDPVSPDKMLARFRSRDRSEVRQSRDGRWIERYEREAPGGGTVGLRVDVTELKHKEMDLERSRALLQETIDVLPAAITLWDHDERLVMFNEVAAGMNPRLRQPDYIGRTYSDVVGELMADIEKTGIVVPSDWLERFRAKAASTLVHLPDGRWFDWAERATPSGHTVGLRVDITDLKNREFELQRAQAQYRALVDSLSDVVYAIDAQGRFTFVSTSVAELLGVPSEQLLGQRFIDYLVPGDVQRAVVNGRAHLKSAENAVRLVQLAMKRPDGTVRHVEVRYRKPAGDLSDNAIQVGVIRDITERMDLTERLQKQVAEIEQARSEYEALVDSLGDLVVKIDPATGAIIFASAAAFELWGYPPSELIGRRVYDFVAADDLERVMAQAQAALKEPKGITQLQYRARARNGEERHVEGRFRLVPGIDGKPAIVGVTQDIEHRVQLERRLAEEMGRLRSIFNTGGVVMALMDSELRYVMVNQDFVDAVGMPEDRIIGRTAKDVLGNISLDLDMIGRWRSGPIRSGQDDVMRYTRTFKDKAGRQRFFSTTVKPITDELGTFKQMLLLAVDDTERRAAEQALFDAERLTTVGEMAATLAHEISQPLQVINIACASAEEEIALSRDNGSPLDAQYVGTKLGRIGKQVERATRIVSELRAFVRGTAEERPSSFDPTLAVQGAVDLTSHGVRQAGGVLATALAPDLPSLMGHVGRLEQVLINLINNARDAGAARIAVSAGPTRLEGRQLVRIAVEDTGPGIAPHVLPRLFEGFVTTKPRGKGTGLGLRICRRIVEEMGGTISAANRAEGGACFEILLPSAAISHVAAD